MSTLPSQKSVTACDELLQLQRLGEDVSKLTGGFHLDQAHLAVLNRLVREMLANIDVLGAFESADHVVAPFNSGGVVLVFWCVGCLRKTHVRE